MHRIELVLIQLPTVEVGYGRLPVGHPAIDSGDCDATYFVSESDSARLHGIDPNLEALMPLTLEWDEGDRVWRIAWSG